MPFALLLVAGSLAQRIGLIPTDVDVKAAIEWAWQRYTKSADAEVLDPDMQMIAHLQAWVLSGWDVTVKDCAAANGVNNREASAWYDKHAVYIPKNEIVEAAGGSIKESQIGP